MKKFNTFLKNILKFVLAGNNLWSACVINEKTAHFKNFCQKKVIIVRFFDKNAYFDIDKSKYQ